MRYRNSGGFVAADRPTISQEQLRSKGEELEQLIRSEVYEMAHLCAKIPEPTEAFHALSPTRARHASLSQLGMMLSALANDPTLPARRLSVFELRLHGWFSSQLQRTQSSLRAAAEHEMLCEATANVSGMRALFAAEQGDVVALRQGLADTNAHLDALRVLRDAQTRTLRELESARGWAPPVRRVILVGASATQ